jgi:hypothetical protein
MNLKSQGSSNSSKIHVIIDDGRVVSGEIVDVSRIGLNARLPLSLKDGITVHFRIDGCGCISTGKVVYCRPDGAKFLVALSILSTGENWRKESRLAANGTVALTVMSSEHKSTIFGRLIDISQSGVGLFQQTYKTSV